MTQLVVDGLEPVQIDHQYVQAAAFAGTPRQSALSMRVERLVVQKLGQPVPRCLSFHLVAPLDQGGSVNVHDQRAPCGQCGGFDYEVTRLAVTPEAQLAPDGAARAAQNVA